MKIDVIFFPTSPRHNSATTTQSKQPSRNVETSLANRQLRGTHNHGPHLHGCDCFRGKHFLTSETSFFLFFVFPTFSRCWIHTVQKDVDANIFFGISKNSSQPISADLSFKAGKLLPMSSYVYLFCSSHLSFSCFSFSEKISSYVFLFVGPSSRPRSSESSAMNKTLCQAGCGSLPQLARTASYIFLLVLKKNNAGIET